MFKSPQTTWSAILAFVALVASQIGYLFDADALTNPDWGLIVTNIIILFGLLKARDNDVTSENAGAK